MRAITTWTALVSCALLVSGIVTSNATATEGETTVECEVTLSPATVAVSGEPAEIEAELANSIGAVTDVEAPVESGLAVIEIVPSETQAVALKLDTSGAVEGTWNLVFEGEAGTCSASISVEAA